MWAIDSPANADSRFAIVAEAEAVVELFLVVGVVI
jgi:hypothetical protein